MRKTISTNFVMAMAWAGLSGFLGCEMGQIGIPPEMDRLDRNLTDEFCLPTDCGEKPESILYDCEGEPPVDGVYPQGGNVLGCTLFESSGKKWCSWKLQDCQVVTIPEFLGSSVGPCCGDNGGSYGNIYDAHFTGERVVSVGDNCQAGKPPTGIRGQPRVDYARTYVLLPQDANSCWAKAVVEASWDNRFTVGSSADDAGIGNLNIRRVVAVNPDNWNNGDNTLLAFFETYYPGIIYVPVTATTPIELKTKLNQLPALPNDSTSESFLSRGLPRVQYQRTYVLLPQNADKTWAAAAIEGSWDTHRYTIGASADDAGIGRLDTRKVVVVNPANWTDDIQGFFNDYYPGIQYSSITAADAVSLKNQLIALDDNQYVLGGQHTPAVTCDAAPPTNLLRNPGMDGTFQKQCTWRSGPEWVSVECPGTPVPPEIKQWETVQVPQGWTAWWRQPNENMNDPNYYNSYPNYCGNNAPPDCKPWHNPEYRDTLGGENDPSKTPPRKVAGDNSQKYFTFYSVHQAGMYQVLDSPVAPGQKLRFSVWMEAWSSTNNKAFLSEGQQSMNLQVGIDPYGGNNPWSANIIWSSPGDSFDRFTLFSVEVVAQSNRASVWTRSEPVYSIQHNDVYIDEASLTIVP